MELRQLRYFIAVAEEQNFGAAAKRLHISQPPITRQIKKLEEELGVSLLVRTTKGAELTPAGLVFLEDARKTLAQVDRGVRRSRAVQNGELGTLEIGYFGSTAFHVVPSILRSFRKLHPNVSIKINRLSKREQVDALLAGHLQIGFGRYYAEEPNIKIEPIVAEGLSVALPEDFGKIPAKSRLLSLFTSNPLIIFPAGGRPNFADEVIGILKREGTEPDIGGIAEDVRSALTYTSIGTGLTIVPSSVARFSWPGIKFVRLDAFEEASPVACVYREGDTSPLLRTILRVVQDFKTS